MNHGLMDVLSVWWIVLLVDLSVVYAFYRLVKKTTPDSYYKNNSKIPKDLLP